MQRNNRMTFRVDAQSIRHFARGFELAFAGNRYYRFSHRLARPREMIASDSWKRLPALRDNKMCRVLLKNLTMRVWTNEGVKALQPIIKFPVGETASVKTENVLEVLIKDVHMNSKKLLEIEAEADRILKSGIDDEFDILARPDSVKESWETFMQSIDKLKYAQIEQERFGTTCI
ncbi:unnamed protein product, partial [Mesorhabditis belari]|uniref:Uncharacterized protein n=1 Tax=Mesorhabditis belari TaxID=2138241 RepID=A0AAF3FBZ1_9BILA